LRDICANPDDTGARLVYADWLDEHGDEKDRIRAEFIRLQCRIAALPEYEPERLDLQEEEKILLDEHGDVWIREVPRWARAGPRWAFRRGLVEHVTIEPGVLVERGEELFARAPVRSVELRSSDEPAPWLDCPLLGRLSELIPGRRGLTAGDIHRAAKAGL